MRNTSPLRSLGTVRRFLIAGALVVSSLLIIFLASSGAQVVQLQNGNVVIINQGVAVAQQLRGVDPNDFNGPIGFTLRRGDVTTGDLLADFEKFSKDAAWEKAFAALAKIVDADSSGLVPSGDGFYMPAGARLRQLLAALPPEGRQAFRVFNDSQARRSLAALDVPSRSDDAVDPVATLQDLFERYFITSVGDQIADKLGDALYERGDFNAAAECWGAVLNDFPDTTLSVPRLSVKRAMALARAGRAEAFATAMAQIREKYSDQSVKIGGNSVRIASLVESLPAPTPVIATASVEPLPAPTTGPTVVTRPLWRSVFADENLMAQVKMLTSNAGTTGVANPSQMTPSSAVDEKRLYLHWFGVTMAIDSITGKLLWLSEPMSSSIAKRQQAIVNGYDIGESGLTVVPGGGRLLLVNGSATPRTVQIPAGPINAAQQAAAAQQAVQLAAQLELQAVAAQQVATAAAARPTTSEADRAAAAQLRVTAAQLASQAAAARVAAQRGGAQPQRVVSARAGSGQLTCINTADGRPLWGTELGAFPNWNFQGEPLVWGEIACVIAMPIANSTSELHLLGIAISNGAIRFDITLGNTSLVQNNRGLMIAPRPLIRAAGDTLFVLTGNGALLSVDLPSQRINWAYTFPTPAPVARSAYPFGGAPDAMKFPAAIQVSGTTICFKERLSNMVYALDTAGPSLKWSRQVDSDGTILLADDSSLLLFSDDFQRIDLPSREMRWNVKTALSTSYTQPLVLGSHAYVYGSKGVYDVNLSAGLLETLSGYEGAGGGGTVRRSDDRMIVISNRAAAAYPLPKQR